MLNDKKARVRAEQRKEVVSTLSDDSGCVTEMTDTPKTNPSEVKVDVPFVPLYLDDNPSDRLPRIDKRSVRTLKVHFEFLATTPFNPLKRPNWWIGDEDSSDTESTKSEPDDVNTSTINSSRPLFQRPYSSPNSLFRDKINENIANNVVEVGAINADIDTATTTTTTTAVDVDSINDVDNVPGMR